MRTCLGALLGWLSGRWGGVMFGGGGVVVFGNMLFSSMSGGCVGVLSSRCSMVCLYATLLDKAS